VEVELDLDFDTGLSLGGRLLLDGQPVAGVSLSLSPAGGGIVEGVQTDHQGGFRFTGLAPGDYWLGVHDLARGLREAEPVSLAADREVVLDLETVVVSGQVVDAADGSPIPGAWIRLERDGAADPMSPATQSDAQGRFRFARVARGSYRLTAQKEGYAAAATSLSASSPREMADMALRLTPTAESGGLP
jgi:uncharacterized surface anchored protein